MMTTARPRWLETMGSGAQPAMAPMAGRDLAAQAVAERRGTGGVRRDLLALGADHVGQEGLTRSAVAASGYFAQAIRYDTRTTG